jgi:hypothetical protein
VRIDLITLISKHWCVNSTTHLHQYWCLWTFHVSRHTHLPSTSIKVILLRISDSLVKLQNSTRKRNKAEMKPLPAIDQSRFATCQLTGTPVPVVKIVTPKKIRIWKNLFKRYKREPRLRPIHAQNENVVFCVFNFQFVRVKTTQNSGFWALKHIIFKFLKNSKNTRMF